MKDKWIKLHSGFLINLEQIRAVVKTSWGSYRIDLPGWEEGPSVTEEEYEIIIKLTKAVDLSTIIIDRKSAVK